MDTLAVVFEKPEHLRLQRVDLVAPAGDDVVVAVAFSGISTGTERLLWTGRMPPFPGMGYPLVPGYESVGRVVGAGANLAEGTFVFVPGSRGFSGVRGLFGGAAARIVVPAARALPIDEALGERGVLLALAATAHHALVSGPWPDLIVGHGVLGRLLARLCLALGASAPTVWERAAARRDGAHGYGVVDPADDPRRDYGVICDASGAPEILDDLIARLAPGGEIVLAGFYDSRLSFAFAPAFMREVRLRVAAQWQPADLIAVRDLVAAGRLSLDGLVSHRRPAAEAAEAYDTAFTDPACLKMVLRWRDDV